MNSGRAGAARPVRWFEAPTHCVTLRGACRSLLLFVASGPGSGGGGGDSVGAVFLTRAGQVVQALP
ncbi:hypothetical protein ABZ318_34285 [Streptomyces sp. NPDC006197]|uniref:hypothetical protein n=1 Tax=Streptomyces sp. NPDC006197 TaxID=3156685 RepID=UPI0033B595AC